MATVKIYHLTNPNNGQIFYVGATKQSLALRQLGHISWGINPTCKILHKERKLPIITEIESCHVDQASERESYWIKQMKLEGHPIENRTEISRYTQQHYTRLSRKKVVAPTPAPPPNKENIIEEWVSESRAAEILNIKKIKLQRMVYAGKIPMKAVKKNVIGKRQYHAPTLQSPSKN